MSEVGHGWLRCNGWHFQFVTFLLQATPNIKELSVLIFPLREEIFYLMFYTFFIWFTTQYFFFDGFSLKKCFPYFVEILQIKSLVDSKEVGSDNL